MPIIKDFPNPKTDSVEFEHHFGFIINMYQPGLLSVCQFLQMLGDYFSQGIDEPRGVGTP